MSRDDARRYVVAYDIPDDRRRARIAKKLGSYGDRVQFSVFVIDVRPARVVRLMAELQRLMHPEEDSILLCEVGPVIGAERGRFQIFGRARPLTDGTALIF